jgi:ankyrin repeat protein
MGSSDSKQAPLQPFEKPGGVTELWELGLEKNHDLLKKALQPLHPNTFNVTDNERERHLAEICDLFEKSKDEFSRNALHHAMYALNPDAACRLLVLGMNPSSTDCAGRTPAHWLVVKWRKSAPTIQNSRMDLPEFARTVWLCRPALFAADWENQTAHSYSVQTLEVRLISSIKSVMLFVRF